MTSLGKSNRGGSKFVAIVSAFGMTLAYSAPASAIIPLRGVTFSDGNMTCTVFYRGTQVVGEYCTESTGEAYCYGEVPKWEQAVCDDYS